MLQMYKFESVETQEKVMVNVFDLIENGVPIDSEGEEMILTAYSDGQDWVPVNDD